MRTDNRKVYKNQKDTRGCLLINSKHNKIPETLRVARLVAETFRPDWKPHLWVTYADGNPANCRVENLVFRSPSQVAEESARTRKGPTRKGGGGGKGSRPDLKWDVVCRAR